MNVLDLTIQGNSKQETEPTPDNPIEVETVNTQANIIICSNNLYDNKDMMDFDCKYEEDDYIKCEYDNTSGTSIIFKNFFTNDSKLIKPDKVYWVILEVKEVKGTGKIQLLYDSANIQLSGWYDFNFSSLKSGEIKIIKVTSNANSNNANMLLRSYCQFGAGESGSITFRISISPVEVTAENFKYIPFMQQTKVVDIQQEMLEGDYFVKEEDGWKEVHGWAKVIAGETEINVSYFDAPSKAIADTLDTAYFQISSVKLGEGEQDKTLKNNIKSNYFKNLYTGDEIWGNVSTDNSYLKESIALQVWTRLRIKKERLEGYTNDLTSTEKVTLLNNYLQQQYNNGNPIYCWYKLATPTKLACTEKQSAQLDDLLNTSTYKNVTHIYSTDKVSPVIKIKYRKDIESMFNIQQNNYETRLSNIEKLLSTTTTSALLLDNLQTDLEKEVL